jgi:hypothetical protein
MADGSSEGFLHHPVPEFRGPRLMLSGAWLAPATCQERPVFDDGAVTAWSISADTDRLGFGVASLNGSSSQVLIVAGGGATAGWRPHRPVRSGH